MSKRVFKYRGGSKEILYRDINTLSEDKIYSAPIDALNDLNESKIKIHNQIYNLGKLISLITLQKYTDNLKQAEVKYLNALKEFIDIIKGVGVYSLSTSFKDELLWAYYADSHKGFCIEYDLDELMSYSMKQEKNFEVLYQKDVPIITIKDIIFDKNDYDNLIYKLIATKSLNWKHEREIRLITYTPGYKEYDFRAVKAIYFGFRSDPNLRERIMYMLQGRDLKYFIIEPKEYSYSLIEREIEDIYIGVKKYRDRIAPILDGVPYFDEVTLPYKELINKAIEIIRRDPYCEEITDAYISDSNSKTNDPAFYITYTRSDGISDNFFLRKSEIENTEIL